MVLPFLLQLLQHFDNGTEYLLIIFLISISLQSNSVGLQYFKLIQILQIVKVWYIKYKGIRKLKLVKNNKFVRWYFDRITFRIITIPICVHLCQIQIFRWFLIWKCVEFFYFCLSSLTHKLLLKSQHRSINFHLYKKGYLLHSWFDKGFKIITIVHRTYTPLL